MRVGFTWVEAQVGACGGLNGGVAPPLHAASKGELLRRAVLMVAHPVGYYENRAVLRMRPDIPPDAREPALEDVLGAVSYTHLTLPTKRIV